MSGTASVTNTFASAVTATGAQLDTNYNNLTAYLNDPTNRNNYAADTGNTNTVVLTMSPAVLGYTTGLEICFKAANTNSGATVINVNGLGNKNLVNSDSSNLGSASINIGAVYDAVYDGTQFVGIGFTGGAATAAQVSTAVSLTTFIPPGRSQNQPGVAKAWAHWIGTSTGTITADSSYNVSTIVRNGTGTYTIAFSTPMANTVYPSVASISSGGSGYFAYTQSEATTQCVVTTFGLAGSAFDFTQCHFICFGNQ